MYLPDHAVQDDLPLAIEDHGVALALEEGCEVATFECQRLSGCDSYLYHQRAQ